MDSVGNIFGDTYDGGANDTGTVFKFAKGGSAIQTISFGSEGGAPDGGLTVDKFGNVFGTTTKDRRVFELPAGAHSLTYIAGFAPFYDFPVGALAIAPDGTLYGTADGSDLNGSGFIFSVARPAKVLVHQQPVISSSGLVSVSAALTDAKNKLIPSGSSACALTLKSGPTGAPSAFTPVTINSVNGIATFTFPLPTLAGKYIFQITEGLLTPVVTRPIIIKAAKALRR